MLLHLSCNQIYEATAHRSPAKKFLRVRGLNEYLTCLDFKQVKFTLNTLVFSNSECTLETPFTVWEQTIARFAIRILCQTIRLILSCHNNFTIHHQAMHIEEKWKLPKKEQKDFSTKPPKMVKESPRHQSYLQYLILHKNTCAQR